MMYWLRRIFGFFVSRAFWIFVGVVALSLFVWFAGPLFAFADYRPLESTKVRWWIIGCLFGLYFLWLLISFWRRRRVNNLLFSGIGRIKDAVESQRKNSDVSDEVLELQSRFSTAAKTLKDMRVEGKSRNGVWGRKFIYELPWYIIVGAPGSGKTTALVNSGLDFPLAGQYGKAALQGIGGTRNCDWWFTDQAVVIDTAGRYTTHDSNEDVDKIEWQGFLGLLKKYRPRQPVNGVVLTLSVSDLLTFTDEELVAHLTALRERLNELQSAFAIELPVYLWVTKVDLLAGFNEYFGGYSKEQRNQVWGFTFPYSDKAKTNRPTKAAFEQEWAALQSSLFSVQDSHLAHEQDLRRRNYIYAFPQQFAGLQSRLSRAVDFVFAESRLTQQPLLRGVYFSSGTQEGTVFDRVLGSLRRQFSTAGKVPTAQNTDSGKSYFLHDLLVKVIFAESHLAGRNVKWERRTRALTYMGYALSALLLVGAIGAWVVSYGNNNRYLAQTEENAQKVSKSIAHYDSNTANLSALLGLLGQVKGIADTDAFPSNDPPMSYRYGLYQGEKVTAASDAAYQRMLENGLLPFVSKRLETLLQNPPVNNLEYLYEALKAYLMLQQSERYSPKGVRDWVITDIKTFLLPDADPATAESIEKHVGALFADDRVVSSPYPINEPLVSSTRLKLSTLSTAQRAYFRLRSRLMLKDMREFNIMDVAGPQAANVFMRKSGLPLNRGVPGLFTYQGYWDLFDKSVNSVVTEVSDDEGWVLGLPAQTLKTQATDALQGKLVREVRLLFLREYQQTWSQLMQDVQLIPSDSLATSIQRMSVLSAPDSPLPLFLRAVVRETTLLREPDKGQQTVVDKMAQKLKNTRDDFERVVGPVPGAHTTRENRDERIVDDHFEPLRRLVGAPGQQTQGNMPIDSLIKTLDEYYGTLIAADAAHRSGGTPPPNDMALRLKTEASRLPAPLGQMLGGIANTTSRSIQAMANAKIDTELRANVGDFCRKAVAGRYPLNRGATNDVTPQDFARLFGPAGLMDDFFNRNLAQNVDTTTWTYKKNIDGSTTGGGASLGSFQKASVIKSVFFSGDSMPKLRIEMKVVEMDPSISNMALDIDGTVIRYAHGPQMSQPVIWPGSRGRQQVSLQITDKNGGQGAMTADGAWALHRFFDKLTLAAGSRPESFTATAMVGDKKVVFEVTAGSVQNPFRLNQLQTFSCPG
ncbi:type VI secretion system membrane subunit TssM [Diaphorobacter sp. HDW4A]|uniref:type VI secretion system membrane subunit TssM n=1 Tax=Diaphorobacter sp. HDW4A TaxID=2714924 RepID=UPI00140A53DB|nr:type VI secretion system membrane subunit TssM [Diaphorobacter sp. HDW4A]QIL80304.1 type VI secretion system membrane subunit TssM [Diaphorobacter sp. HDW4A]